MPACSLCVLIAVELYLRQKITEYYSGIILFYFILFFFVIIFVQSAATIHVPYDGVIKQLMYEVGDIATLGNPLIMLEIDGDATGKDCIN